MRDPWVKPPMRHALRRDRSRLHLGPSSPSPSVRQPGMRGSRASCGWIVSLGLTVERAEKHRSARTSQGSGSATFAEQHKGPLIHPGSAARLDALKEGPVAPVVAGRWPPVPPLTWVGDLSGRASATLNSRAFSPGLQREPLPVRPRRSSPHEAWPRYPGRACARPLASACCWTTPRADTPTARLWLGRC